MRAHRTCWQAMRRWTAVAFAALLLVPIACSDESDEAGAPSETTSAVVPTTVMPADQQQSVQEFVDSCEQAVSTWRSGVIDWPQTLEVQIDRTVLYEAAIDLRSTPLPADAVIRSAEATSEPVSVQCQVAARLRNADDGLSVASDSEGDADDWVLQEFTPTGVVTWAWAVRALRPGDHDVTLELKPAVSLSRAAYAGSSTVHLVTTVHVRASHLARMEDWVRRNKVRVTFLFATFTAAVLAVLKFGSATHLQALAKRFGSWFMRDKGKGGPPTSTPSGGSSAPTATKRTVPTSTT